MRLLGQDVIDLMYMTSFEQGALGQGWSLAYPKHQIGSVISIPAFHLGGPWFESNLRPGALHIEWVFSPYLIAEGSPFGVFLPHLKMNISSRFLVTILFFRLDWRCWMCN